MTLEEYIANPMGKNNAVMSAIVRENQKNTYRAKFNQVLLRENGSIHYKCYYDEKPNVYWFHVKVPSEHVKHFYYDVVFKFFTNAENGTSNNLLKWNIQFYSNDPAFVYTYAYAFNDRDLFIKELTSRMSKTALTTPSKEKNPSEMIGYSKIVFFAYLVLENKSLTKLNVFKANLSVFSPKAFVNTIDNADNKIEDRQSQKVSTAKKKSVSEKEYKNIKRTVGGKLDSNVNIRTNKKISKIKSSAGKVGTVHKIGKISRKK